MSTKPKKFGNADKAPYIGQPMVHLKHCKRPSTGAFQVTIPKSWVDRTLTHDQGVDIFQVPGSEELRVLPSGGKS